MSSPSHDNPSPQTPPTAFSRPPSSLTPSSRGWLGLSPMAWMQIGVVAVLFAALFWPNLRRLWLKTNPFYGADAANWSHSMLVPVIGLYYLWLRREALLSAPVRPLLAGRFSRSRLIGGSALLVGGLLLRLIFGLGAMQELIVELPVVGNLSPYIASMGVGLAILGPLVLLLDWGLGTLLGGMLLAAYGIWPGRNDYVKDLGMVMTLFGVVLTLTGWRVMKVAWFPIAFLICAIPWPGLVYTKVAIPLQYMAAKVAVIVLNVAQVDAVVEGTRIVIDKASGVRVLNVAEACAGMRSLMTFITIGAAMAFLSVSRPMWQKLVIVASAVPIAIFCNVMRVSGQGLLDVYVTEKASEGFAHMFVGLVMLIPAFFLLLGVGWVLDQVFIEEEDAEEAPAGAAEHEATPQIRSNPAGGTA